VDGINYEHEEDGSEVYTDGMECAIRKDSSLEIQLLFIWNMCVYRNHPTIVGFSASESLQLDMKFFWKENTAAASWNARAWFSINQISGISSHVG